MTSPARFDFAQDFSSESGADGLVSLPRQDFETERAACQAEGYARGFADGETAASAATEARLAIASEQLLASMTVGTASLAEQLATIEQEAVRLALTLARKLAAQALAADPLAGVEQAFRALIGDLCHQQEVAIHLHPDLIAPAETRLAALLAVSPATCALRFVPDVTLAPADARIDWAQGGLVLDRREREARLESIVERAFAPVPEPENVS